MRRQTVMPAAVSLLALALLGCSQSGNPGSAGRTTATPSGRGSPTDASATAPVVAGDYARAAFTAGSAHIDNRWMGYRVGRQWEMRGSALDGEQTIQRRVVATVTDLTKRVDGVRTAVLYEEDFDDGALVEAEISFYAQDAAGNVWHMGEYPEEYENGRFVGAPTWIAGQAGATAGVMMRAEPRAGTAPYAEGYAPAPVNWDDHAKVLRTGERVCVSTGCYHKVTEIAEFEPDVPRAFQNKFYAPGVGNVAVGWSGANEDDHETLHLVRLRHLSAAQQAQIRHRALVLQASAYRHSPGVYGRTAPAR
jgi:hypothetical protein